MWNIREIKERERKFREKELPFEVFTIQTKTRWWNMIELFNVFSQLKGKDGDNVLDVGCSDGRFLWYLHRRFPNCRLVGIDFAVNPLEELLRRNFKGCAVCGDISEMPFKAGSFDRAVAIQVIQQIPSRGERVKVLKNIRSVLSENGMFVLTVLNQKSWSNLVSNGKEGPLITAKDLYVYLYNPVDLCEELEEAGFFVTRIMGINNLPGRYVKRLGALGVFLDISITRMFKLLSIRKGRYLLASCRKK